jgi:hypothetical protein
MKIKLKVTISGTRDGIEWPPMGGSVDLPEAEATQMVAAGLASAVTTPAPVETATANTATVETRKRVRRG